MPHSKGGTTILIADEFEVTRKLLRALLEAEDYRIVEAKNGVAALEIIRDSKTPLVGLIDWEIPELEGIDVCRQASTLSEILPLYLILFTTRNDRPDIIQGLNSGANDCIIKPFDLQELLARVRIGIQSIQRQKSLHDQVSELQNTLTQAKSLRGPLPICIYCKKVRDASGCWQDVETYIETHSTAKVSHGVCTDCQLPINPD